MVIKTIQRLCIRSQINSMLNLLCKNKKSQKTIRAVVLRMMERKKRKPICLHHQKDRQLVNQLTIHTQLMDIIQELNNIHSNNINNLEQQLM